MSSGDRLSRDGWLVQGLPAHGTAAAFIRRYHYSRSSSNTSTYRHGLYADDETTRPLVGELMGVAMWIPPTRAAAVTVDENWRGVLSLSRFAVHPDAPPNAASFLLAASMRFINRVTWPTLVTYADPNQGHTGAIYRATNWICLGEVPAGDTWTGPNGEQRGRKRGGRTLTVAEMQALGYCRNPDTPKIKFVHRTRRSRPPVPATESTPA